MILPVDVLRLFKTFVGEVVMKSEITPFLAAARDRGAPSKLAPTCFSTDPAYLEFFGFPPTTAEVRAVARFESEIIEYHRLQPAASRALLS